MNDNIINKGNDFDVIKPSKFRQHKDVIKDLFDNSGKVRGEGRSTILAEVFLDLAKENPNNRIKIIDHWEGHHAVATMVKHILHPMLEQRNEELKKQDYRAYYRLMGVKEDYYVIYSTVPQVDKYERTK